MTKHEQIMIELGCPKCGGEINLYNTNPTGSGGRYKCIKCGRDTVWGVGKAISGNDILKLLNDRIKLLPNEKGI